MQHCLWLLPSPALLSLSCGVASVVQFRHPSTARSPLPGPQGLSVSLPPLPVHLSYGKGSGADAGPGGGTTGITEQQMGSGAAKSPPAAAETRTKGSTSALLRLTLGQLQVLEPGRILVIRKGPGQCLLPLPLRSRIPDTLA